MALGSANRTQIDTGIEASAFWVRSSLCRARYGTQLREWADDRRHVQRRQYGGVVVRPNVYRTNRPIVDPYGVVSTEVTVDGSRLLHAGPFTARHRPGV